MSLPNVTFIVASDGLGRLAAEVLKVPGIVLTGETVAEGANIGTSYQIFSLQEAVDLGIAENGANAFAYKQIKEFYDEAGDGAELWFMLVSDATTYEQMGDINENIAKKLIGDAGGNIRVLGLCKKSTGAEVIEEGIDSDVKLGIIKAQALAEHFAAKYMPFRVAISGNDFNGTVADLFDYKTAEYNRVLMFLANTDGSPEASIGLMLGRLASIPTQRSIARVKDGSITDLEAFFTNGDPVESLTNAWDNIHDLGYTFLRNFPGRAGYYITDDQTLTKKEDDFSALARGLVMDEAVLIAFTQLTEELSDEIPLTADGKIHPAIIKNWQTNIETQLEGLMVSQGKLSNARVIIDPDQNVLQADKVVVRIELQPVGYAKFIEVNIGFNVNTEE